MKRERIYIDSKPSMGIRYDSNDFEKMKEMYRVWKHLNEALALLGSRGLNVPDLFSEGLFCYLYDIYRVNGSSNSHSYDAFDVKNNKGIQIKSCSIDNDCTSFGPKSTWDQIYFMKFYPNSDDGKVEIYDISFFDFDNLILNHEKNETFKIQQSQGRRPRFSVMKEIINKYNVRPIKTIHLLE